MKVSLKSITPNAEINIVEIARVSSTRNDKSEKPEGLINYLIKNAHWSPFEHSYLTFEIETSKAIGIQLLRHRSFTFQELCMAGDTEVYFDLPGAIKNGKRQLFKKSLKELFEQWSEVDGIGNSKKNRIKQMKIRYYDNENKILTHSNIKEVFQTGIKDIFEIELENGKKIKCTKEHKVLGPDGFVSLEEGVGLSLNGKTATISNPNFSIATNGVPVYQSIDWLKKAKKQSIQNKMGIDWIAKEAGVSYHTIRKWLKKLNLSFSKKETSQTFDVWNKNKTGYSWGRHSLGAIQKMRERARRGPSSNLWRGGVERSERIKIGDWCATIRAEKLLEADFKCKECKSNKDLHLDHIIPVFKNKNLAYDKNNIQVLCKKCHHSKHGIRGDYKIWREKSKGNKLTVEWSKIKSVKYIGKEMTYDLEVEGSCHNYVANGVIVHNSQRYAKVNEVEPIELRKQAATNRQSSEEAFDPKIEVSFFVSGLNSDKLVPVYESASALVDEHMKNSFKLYDQLIEAGVAKECARMVLPMATKTTIYMTGSVRSWIHFLQIRDDSHAQLEAQLIAKEIKKLFIENLPIISTALGYKSGENK